MSRTDARPPDETSARVLAALRRWGRKRVGLDEGIWPAFQEADPVAAAAFDRRRRLRRVLDGLATASCLGFPRQAHLYDTSAAPPLPRWVRLSEPPGPSRSSAFEPGGHPWHPALAFLADQPTLANAGRWLALDRWLKAAPADPARAVDRERSFEIFGDEKVLEAFVRTELFRRHVPYDLLACYPLYEPLGWEVFEGTAAAPVALVIENPATWHTIANWNRERGLFAAVVYGRGNSFMRAWRDVDRLQRAVRITTLFYFGDLDAQGLAIPSAAARGLAADVGGGVALRPAVTLYRMLLEKVPADRWQPARDARATGDDVLGWLDEPLRGRVRALFEQDRRIPQEAVQRPWLDGVADALTGEIVNSDRKP